MDNPAKYLNEADSIIADLRALAERADKMGSRGRGDTGPFFDVARDLYRRAFDLRRQAVSQAIDRYVSTHHRLYPMIKLHDLKSLALDKQTTCLETYNEVIGIVQESADEETLDDVMKCLRSNIITSESLVQSPKVLRFGIDLFRGGRITPDEPLLIDYVEYLVRRLFRTKCGNLKETIKTLKGQDKVNKVELSDPGVIVAFRAYKNGALDLYFNDRETVLRLAEELHPTTPGQHHTYRAIPRGISRKLLGVVQHPVTLRSVQGIYHRCVVCGHLERVPEHSLDRMTIKQSNAYVTHKNSHPSYNNWSQGVLYKRGRTINLTPEQIALRDQRIEMWG